jgi:hypothetical protein
MARIQVRKQTPGLAVAIAVLTLLTASSFAQPRSHAKPTPMVVDRASDSYAIYSLLMPGVPFDSMSPDQASHFAIAGTTVNINDMNPAIPPDGQLQPPPNNEKAFQEAVQDFHTHRYERVQLERQLKIDRPYTLHEQFLRESLRQWPVDLPGEEWHSVGPPLRAEHISLLNGQGTPYDRHCDHDGKKEGLARRMRSPERLPRNVNSASPMTGRTHV